MADINVEIKNEIINALVNFVKNHAEDNEIYSVRHIVDTIERESDMDYAYYTYKKIMVELPCFRVDMYSENSDECEFEVIKANLSEVVVPKIPLPPISWKKEKNEIIFYDKNDEESYRFDFNTNNFNISRPSHNRITNEFLSTMVRYIDDNTTPEWVYNYPDLLNKESLLDEVGSHGFEKCPKGYIKYIKERHELISLSSLKRYGVEVLFADIKTFYAKECARCLYEEYPTRLNRVSDMLIKYSERIDYVFEHEHLEIFYSDINKEEWGGDDDIIPNSRQYAYKRILEYFEFCKDVEEEPIFKNFLKNYCVVKEIARIKKHKEISEEIAKNNDKSLAFENDDIIVIVPTTYEEFKHEADYQHNCVCSMYAPKVAKNTTNVVFVRKKSEPNIPYVTCEVSKSGKIVQYRTRFNDDISTDFDRKCREVYTKYLKKIFKDKEETITDSFNF